MEVFEALHSGPYTAIAIITLLAATLKITKSLLEFHDEHLQKRHLKMLSFLAAECEKDVALTQLVTTARHEAVFRRVWGRSASPEFMTALSKLYETGKFTLAELRISSLYLKVNDGHLKMQLGATANSILTVSILIILAMGIYITMLIATVLKVNTSAAYLGAVVLIAIYSFFFWYVGRDVRAVLVAYRVRSKLNADRM